MKISKQEETVLARIKYLEGKDYKTIKRELERDNDFMKNHVITKRELIKEVANLSIQKDRLKQEINLLSGKKQKLMISQMDFSEKVITDDSKKKFASVRHLYRILNYIEDNPCVKITSIYKDSLMSSQSVKECLHFLIKHNLIKEIKNNNGGVVYEKL